MPLECCLDWPNAFVKKLNWGLAVAMNTHWKYPRLL